VFSILLSKENHLHAVKDRIFSHFLFYIVDSSSHDLIIRGFRKILALQYPRWKRKKVRYDSLLYFLYFQLVCLRDLFIYGNDASHFG
jgi:hypothetical protein